MANAETQIFRQTDVMDPDRAAALCACLGRIRVTKDDPLPPFFHHIYFWQAHPADALGRDGHPRPGLGSIPDTGLPRRMWAGGRLHWHAPLRMGTPAEKITTRGEVAHKTGRTGPLAFVTLHHRIEQNGVLCLTEEQDLVYREDDAPRGSPPDAPGNADQEVAMSFSSTDLFRYSALTFNGHRIHYDAAYARDVEGYDGLVVHGPLLAQHLMLMAADQLGPLAAFSFRNTAPLILGDEAVLCRSGQQFWVRRSDGGQCVTATATPQN